MKPGRRSIRIPEWIITTGGVRVGGITLSPVDVYVAKGHGPGARRGLDVTSRCACPSWGKRGIRRRLSAQLRLAHPRSRSQGDWVGF